MIQVVSASDARPTRLRALYDRIERLPEAALGDVERIVTQAEHGVPVEPGATRVVAGATITERPDLVAEGMRVAEEVAYFPTYPEPPLVRPKPGVVENWKAMSGGATLVNGAPGTVQAPEPARPAEVAREGMVRR